MVTYLFAVAQHQESSREQRNQDLLIDKDVAATRKVSIDLVLDMPTITRLTPGLCSALCCTLCFMTRRSPMLPPPSPSHLASVFIQNLVIQKKTQQNSCSFTYRLLKKRIKEGDKKLPTTMYPSLRIGFLGNLERR